MNVKLHKASRRPHRTLAFLIIMSTRACRDLSVGDPFLVTDRRGLCFRFLTGESELQFNSSPNRSVCSINISIVKASQFSISYAHESCRCENKVYASLYDSRVDSIALDHKRDYRRASTHVQDRLYIIVHMGPLPHLIHHRLAQGKNRYTENRSLGSDLRHVYLTRKRDGQFNSHDLNTSRALQYNPPLCKGLRSMRTYFSLTK